MLGNVMEWCMDECAEYPEAGSVTAIDDASTIAVCVGQLLSSGIVAIDAQPLFLSNSMARDAIHPFSVPFN